jgi:thiamine biosynthesis lipoprotein
VNRVSIAPREVSYAEHRFRCMGTEINILGPGAARWRESFATAARRVEEVFVEVNDRFTRFSPDSELSRVNARPGVWTRVSGEFGAILRVALEGALATGGLFDPTVLPALVAAGYDRDFDEVRASPGMPSTPPVGGPTWADVEIRAREVRLPAGAALDFGGIGKGWAVDLAGGAVAELPWALISAGGDLRIFGHRPGGIDVSLDDPQQAGYEAGRLVLQEGALASSSVACRAWGQGLHHLIDPRTSRPAMTGVAQATAWAPTCTEAEIRSTWAMLAGPVALEHFPGVLVLEDTRIITNLFAEGTTEAHAGVPA